MSREKRGGDLEIADIKDVEDCTKIGIFKFQEERTLIISNLLGVGNKHKFYTYTLARLPKCNGHN